MSCFRKLKRLLRAAQKPTQPKLSPHQTQLKTSTRFLEWTPDHPGPPLTNPSPDLPVTGQTPCSAHAALKQLIQRMILEALELPRLREAEHRPEEVGERTYEDLLATAVLNKVSGGKQPERECGLGRGIGWPPDTHCGDLRGFGRRRGLSWLSERKRAWWENKWEMHVRMTVVLHFVVGYLVDIIWSAWKDMIRCHSKCDRGKSRN